ncbi:unnamed protein product [Ilex paraguariensis]|uniref:Transmembrane protein n=1 Tax=Ilex paraguariensis TaxID=185542 RepID=A0ABC8T0I7_9AQUA
MEETAYFHEQKTVKMMRSSIYTFLQHYQFFTTIPLLLILPFSASILLSQALSASSSLLLLTIPACFNSLQATEFSPTSKFVTLFNMNFSQTVFSSIFSLPFALTSLVIAKGLIIQALIYHKSSFPLPFNSFRPIYKPLLVTQLCNSVFTIIVSATAFSIFLAALYFLEPSRFPLNNPLALLVARLIFYSILANAGVVCNLALIITEMENCVWYTALRRALLLSWSRSSMTLSVKLPINLGILAIEVLFRYRVIRVYHLLGKIGPPLALEGLLIAYLYSLLIVLDTIASCLFFKSCKSNFPTDQAGRYYYQIRLVKKESSNSCAKLEIIEVQP